MRPMIHALDIHITREEREKMSPEELNNFANMILESMTAEQLMQVAEIGKRALIDDELGLTQHRSPTALQDMAKKVNVTVNKTE